MSTQVPIRTTCTSGCLGRNGSINRGMGLIRIHTIRNHDAPIMTKIFFDAVHHGTQNYYTHEQRRAWGSDALIPERWRHRVNSMIGFMAEANGLPIGFITIDPEGFIDLAFVSPSALRKGVGWQLYKVVEEKALNLGALVLSTEASMAARPFFERQGWSVIEEQTVVKHVGVPLTNFKMQKLFEILVQASAYG